MITRSKIKNLLDICQEAGIKYSGHRELFSDCRFIVMKLGKVSYEWLIEEDGACTVSASTGADLVTLFNALGFEGAYRIYEAGQIPAKSYVNFNLNEEFD